MRARCADERYRGFLHFLANGGRWQPAEPIRRWRVGPALQEEVSAKRNQSKRNKIFSVQRIRQWIRCVRPVC